MVSVLAACGGLLVGLDILVAVIVAKDLNDFTLGIVVVVFALGIVLLGMAQMIQLWKENNKLQVAILSALRIEHSEHSPTVRDFGRVRLDGGHYRVKIGIGESASLQIDSEEDTDFTCEYSKSFIGLTWVNKENSRQCNIRGLSWGTTDIVIKGNNSKKKVSIQATIQ